MIYRWLREKVFKQCWRRNAQHKALLVRLWIRGKAIPQTVRIAMGRKIKLLKNRSKNNNTMFHTWWNHKIVQNRENHRWINHLRKWTYMHNVMRHSKANDNIWCLCRLKYFYNKFPLDDIGYSEEEWLCDFITNKFHSIFI